MIHSEFTAITGALLESQHRKIVFKNLNLKNSRGFGQKI